MALAYTLVKLETKDMLVRLVALAYTLVKLETKDMLVRLVALAYTLVKLETKDMLVRMVALAWTLVKLVSKWHVGQNGGFTLDTSWAWNKGHVGENGLLCSYLVQSSVQGRHMGSHTFSLSLVDLNKLRFSKCSGLEQWRLEILCEPFKLTSYGDCERGWIRPLMNVAFFICVPSFIFGVHHFGWDFCLCDHFFIWPLR